MISRNYNLKPVSDDRRRWQWHVRFTLDQMNYLQAIVLFFSCIGVSIAEDAKIGGYRLSMPDGFAHRLGKGIDSQPGEFTNTKSGWQIYHDIGIGAHYGSNEKIQKIHEGRITRKEVIETSLGKGMLLVLGPEKRNAFFGLEGIGYFRATISSDQELKDFITIVSSIRLSDEAQKNQNSKAEQTDTGLPATRPESKPEGSDKPQPE